MSLRPMSQALQTLLAILPGLLICAWVFYRDRRQPEPLFLLSLCFLAGMGSAFIAIQMEEWAYDVGIRESVNIWQTLLLAFGVVALFEEGVKFVTLMLFAYPWKPFDEPLDGIVYSVVVAMGFATLENLIYSDIYQIDTVLLRAFTAVPAHAAFAVFMGYHLGLAKFEDDTQRKAKRLVVGFFGALLLHGAYDFFIIQQNVGFLTLFSMAILALSIYYTLQLVNLHVDTSAQAHGEGE